LNTLHAACWQITFIAITPAGVVWAKDHANNSALIITGRIGIWNSVVLENHFTDRYPAPIKPLLEDRPDVEVLRFSRAAQQEAN
jgi:hypothetical protein